MFKKHRLSNCIVMVLLAANFALEIGYESGDAILISPLAEVVVVVEVVVVIAGPVGNKVRYCMV